MKLMLRSYSNLLLSVRQVTQENRGKSTPGIDGQVALTTVQRVNLIRQMQEYSLWKVRPTKRIYIPKANAKLRPLGIPCIKDRIAQAMVKNALEPSWEARFEAHSYGFRPGRSVQDAIEQSHARLRKGCDTWILDADLKGAFDHLSHEFILSAIGQVPGREFIKQWLKAGYVEANQLHATTAGAPQGGVISPLLLNVVLDGMERLLASYISTREQQPSAQAKCQKPYRRKSPTYGFIRYCDDFLITAKSKADLEAIVPTLQDWLQQRGLELNAEKTRIVHVEQGCHFLGFTLQQFNQKCFCRPQKQKVMQFLQRIRDWLKANAQAKTEAVIHYLNPILRGWANFYRHGASKQTFCYVDSQIWEALWRWCRRRHPNKGNKWIARKYFKTIQGCNWMFATVTQDRQGNSTTVSLIRLAYIPIERHVKVKGTNSPDDAMLKEYWEQRQTRYGKTYWERGSKYHQVAKNQNWCCPVCGDFLCNGEAIDTHHQVPLSKGGTNAIDNLVHLHQACHRHLHSMRILESRRLEPLDGTTITSGSEGRGTR